MNTKPSSTAAPKPNKPLGNKLGLRDRILAALPKLPERAATLIENGYRFVVDPDRPFGLLLHKPQTEAQKARLGLLQPYKVTLWWDKQDCRYRYRCTCFHFVGMERNFELGPECKHGLAAIAEHEKRLAEYERALETVAWVEHIEGRSGRSECAPTGRQARSQFRPDYLDRLVAANHFGIATGQPGRHAHIGDIMLDSLDSEGSNG